MEAILVQKALPFFTVKRLKSEKIESSSTYSVPTFCHLYIPSKLGLTFEP